VSGHASGAFFILTLSWIFGYRRWLWVGLLVGSIVGLGRILQGGHFLSDVVFSFWAVYFISQITAAIFKINAPTKI
jgi:lipid A 4'-phosphatase